MSACGGTGGGALIVANSTPPYRTPTTAHRPPSRTSQTETGRVLPLLVATVPSAVPVWFSIWRLCQDTDENSVRPRCLTAPANEASSCCVRKPSAADAYASAILP